MPSDQSQLDEQSLRASHAELAAFVRRLAHDMGAPLRTVQGYTELLQLTVGGQLTGEAQGHLERLGLAVTRLDAMVRALGLYARIGPLPQPDEPTDLNRVAQEAWELLELEVERRAARLDTEELPCIPFADAPLRSVFMNLFDNALRYSGADKPPHVTVSASTVHGEVCITVADDGPGIPEELVDWVSAPLCSGAEDNPGAGMGLAVARAHVEAQGGRLGIDTSATQGARVWFTLPHRAFDSEGP